MVRELTDQEKNVALMVALNYIETLGGKKDEFERLLSLWLSLGYGATDNDSDRESV